MNKEPQTLHPDLSRMITQLKRVSGQVDGIIRMIENERKCIDIINQIIAARNSLSSVGRELLVNQAKCCSKNSDYEQLETILQKLFKN